MMDDAFVTELRSIVRDLFSGDAPTRKRARERFALLEETYPEEIAAAEACFTGRAMAPGATPVSDKRVLH